ncbi:long-chain fatty acid--CoA ligase [Streptomyces sp. LBUM 1479]|nr:long-chain fatty acid--CoA ligase [Streptomyces sp. LBUM 1479]
MDTACTLESGVVRDFLRDLVQVDRPGTRPPPFDTVVEEIHQLGVEPGTPVMVAMPNGAPFVTVVCALLVRGAVPVLLPPSAPPSRVERMARALGADALIAARVPPAPHAGVPPRTLGGFARFARLSGVDTIRYRPGRSSSSPRAPPVCSAAVCTASTRSCATPAGTPGRSARAPPTAS